MTTSQIPTGSLASLNDTELAILRLLASGHTAKSIAARLGRSETAIHERLRDARRKTGIGSSRELARLLDAQKFWDRNFDLSSRGSSTDNPEIPPTGGFAWTKGRLIMLIALPLAALGLTVTSATTTVVAPAAHTPEPAAIGQSPLIGRWALDVARIPADERPRSVTIEFGVTVDGKWTTHVEIVAADGSTMHAESTAATDGVAVSGTGNMPFVDTVSLRHPAPETLVMTLGKNGAPVSTRVYTAAADRKTMTETIIWPGSEIPKMETTYFSRID